MPAASPVGSSGNAVVVTSGKIIGQTARGTVSPDGTVYGTSTGNGIQSSPPAACPAAAAAGVRQSTAAREDRQAKQILAGVATD